MTTEDCNDVRGSYDAVADEYVARIFDELRGKRLDREWLDRFAERVCGKGVVCDVGCGPGQVAGYLKLRGVEVCGVDLSPAMVERAGRLVAGVEFRVGDMMALDVPDGAWAGIAAFYAIVNLTDDGVANAFREWRRVLRAGGALLLAFHVGDEVVHVDELWGKKISLDFHFFPTERVVSQLESAGFVVEDVIEREPYPDIEYPSRRAYVSAAAAAE